MAFRNVIHPAFVFLTVASIVASARRPNIVLIVADDLGWNDVSFHGSNQIPTPNIDALAYNGIILNSHYVPALCTPSRASLLTGKYPTSMGMQHLVILAPEPWGLPLGETLMPEHFKRHGYSTHAIGKWHLGFHQKEYTPIYRGFDSHFGYWNGYQDYYDHTMEDHTLEEAPQPLKGYDMRRGLDVDYSSRGEYSTDAFTNEAVNVISKHNSSQGPLFLYLAHLSPHSGNPDKPFQAPEEEIAKHSQIKDPDRRVYAAMVTRLDEGVGKVVSALREADMLDNSIILFMSDNGAVTFGVHSNRGSNYPLRGLKESPWEGGVRGVAAVWSPLLNRTRRVSNQLMHVSDWLPTLYSAAGLDTSELGQLDGFDLWNALSQDGESPRREVFNNYDEIEDYSSLRVGSWKYIEGTAQAGDVDLWYGESGFDNGDLGYDLDKVLSSRCGLALMQHRIDNQPEGVESTVEPSSSVKTREEMLRLRTESIVTCDRTPFQFRQSPGTNITEEIMAEIKNRIIQEVREIRFKHPLGEREEIGESIALDDVNDPDDLGEMFDCDPLKTVCLFNLEWDPCERVNLARVLPDLVKSMQDRLKILKEGVVKPLNTPGDPFCDPSLHNGTWTNWRDRIYQSEYERALKLFLDSLLHRDILYIIENVILKMVLSPFHSFFNGFDQLNSFISRSYLSAATIAILTLSFLMIYSRKKRFNSRTDSRVGEDGDYSLPLPSLPGSSSRFVKR